MSTPPDVASHHVSQVIHADPDTVYAFAADVAMVEDDLARLKSCVEGR